MKSLNFSKLAAFTGFAAICLLACEASHAQAPSGPMTAAPAQPVGAPAPAANPAPAPKPRTTIFGAWKLNLDESDDPRNRRQDSDDSNSSGRGRTGGGYPGGGYPSGGHGGYGGHRGGGGGESDEQREKMQNLLRPAKSLNVSMTGAEVDVLDDHDFKLALMTDGRKLQKSKDASYQEVAAKWDGNRLASDEKDPRGNKMSRTFELSADGLQLYETLHMTTGRSNSPRVIRYVYDIPVQTAAPTKQ
jgi:hypothetical protein